MSNFLAIATVTAKRTAVRLITKPTPLVRDLVQKSYRTASGDIDER